MGKELLLIDIHDLTKLNSPESIAITKHAAKRLEERSITISDIVEGIKTGEIIKQYEYDKPFPSCLLLGTSTSGKPLHMVLSHDGEFIYLITAYYPNIIQWEESFKTRRDR